MKTLGKNLIEHRWLQELILLVFIFVLFTMNDLMLIVSWSGFWKGCCYFFILYTHAQLNRFFLLPILFKQQQPVLYFLLSVVLVLVFSWILYSVAVSWLYRNCYLYKSLSQDTFSYHVGTIVASFICIMGLILFLRSYRDQKKQAQNSLLTNQMQLNSLRSQLNPHFLFNTFNTLYGISLQYPNRVPDLIMQVSQLMRYQVESNSKNMVALEDELAFVNSYIQLEKERVGKRCEIQYDSKIENAKMFKIAPMLLITFIENAFKHGTCTIEPCYVKINIKVTDGILELNIINSVPKKKNNIISTKIGLKNTTERLNILYEDKYQLNCKEEGGEYILSLNLQLN